MRVTLVRSADEHAACTVSRVAKHFFATNMEGGVSLLTRPAPTELTTTLIRSVKAPAAA
jgi:hypothetical protein